jgi:hypothetical protein
MSDISNYKNQRKRLHERHSERINIGLLLATQLDEIEVSSLELDLINNILAVLKEMNMASDANLRQLESIHES